MGYYCSEPFAFEGESKGEGEGVAIPLKPMYGLNGAPTLFCRGRCYPLGFAATRKSVWVIRIAALMEPLSEPATLLTPPARLR